VPTGYKFDESASSKELIETKNAWLRESRPYHDELLMHQEKCLKYYYGDQTDRMQVPAYSSDVVYNRIFEGTETIVPIITGSAHQFLALPGTDDEIALKNSQALQKVLSRKYVDLDIQKLLEGVARDMILKRYGVLEWGWDIETNDIGVWWIDPRRILIPRLRVPAEDLPYVGLIEEYSEWDIKEYFPNVDINDLQKGRSAEISVTVSTPDKTSDEVYSVILWKTPYYWAWIQGDIILKRIKNPYWDWDGEEYTTDVLTKTGKPKKKKSLRFYNFLVKPSINYVFFTPFLTGDSSIAPTSLAEVAIPISDDINVQKRAITNNLIKTGNGQVYIDSEALPQEIIDQITSEPGLVLVGPHLASENRIRRDPGAPIPQGHFENLAASMSAFDNIFGTHADTRGQGGGETLGGQILNRQQDLSRIDQLTREINRGMNHLADGLVQLMKLFYDAPHLIHIVGEEDTLELLKFQRDMIGPGTVVDVKSGTPIILDPIARSNRAIQMWQLGAIDAESFFKEMDFPDPRAMAQKLLAWKQGQLAMDTNAKIAEGAALAEVGVKADMQKAKQEIAMDRKAETPNDSRARSERAAGGGRAALPGRPNMLGMKKL
jgi:hypothetical protein